MGDAGEGLLIKADAAAWRLLDQFGVSTPEGIDLEAIALALGIEVEDKPLDGAEAHLVRVGHIGTITLSTKLLDAGLRRFALAHELGHWQLHETRSQSFFCSAKDLREYRNSGPELEANTFAAALLMPKRFLDTSWLREEPSWELLERIASRFNVSMVSAAVRYAELAHQPVIAVFSDGRRVRWWRENRSRTPGLWLESEQPVSIHSPAYHAKDEPGELPPSLVQVDWQDWFPHIGNRGDAELYELSGVADARATVVSVLWVP